MISCRIFMCHLYVILIVLMKEYNVQDIAISLSNRNVAWQYMSTQPITLRPQSLKAPSSVKTSSSHRDSPRPTYFTACFCFWIFFPRVKAIELTFEIPSQCERQVLRVRKVTFTLGPAAACWCNQWEYITRSNIFQESTLKGRVNLSIVRSSSQSVLNVPKEKDSQKWRKGDQSFTLENEIEWNSRDVQSRLENHSLAADG